jgi:hypothetical protein
MSHPGAVLDVVAGIARDRWSRVLAGLEVSPRQIGMFGRRYGVAVRTSLPVDRSLDFSIVGVVGVAPVLGARIEVTVDSPLLGHVCRRVGVGLGVVER